MVITTKPGANFTPLDTVSYIQMVCVCLAAVGYWWLGTHWTFLYNHIARLGLSHQYLSIIWLFSCGHIHLVKPWFLCLADCGQVWQQSRGARFKLFVPIYQ